MYDIDRFIEEKVVVHFDEFDTLHEFLCELEETPKKFGVNLSRERFEGGFKSQDLHHVYWDKEYNRLYLTSNPRKTGFVIIESDDLMMETTFQPSGEDVMKFLIGA